MRLAAFFFLVGITFGALFVYRLDHAPPKGPTVVQDMGSSEVMK